MKKVIIVLIVTLFFSAETFAVPALEWTQHANFTKLTLLVENAAKKIELLTKTINSKLQIIEDRRLQAMDLPEKLWINTANHINDVVGTINRAHGIANDLKGIDKKFKEQFKGYEYWLKNGAGMSIGFSQQYTKWQKNNKDASAAAMKVAGINLEDLEEDTKTAKKLKMICRTARGRNACLKAATMVKNHQNDLLRRLLTTINQQSMMQAEFATTCDDKQGLSVANNREVYSVPCDNLPVIGDGAKLVDAFKPMEIGS